MLETLNISEIVTILKTTGIYLIGIDGRDGSGNSKLASLISQELGCPHVNIDDLVDKNCGQYVNYIHYDRLLMELDDAKGPMIIEGVCLLAVLERMDRNLDMLIYIKRVSGYGMWRDEDDYNISEDIDHFMNKKKEEFQKFVEIDAYIEGEDTSGVSNFPRFTEEIIRYHHKYRPHEKADIIYKRII